mmetsp:Transcript_7165/g.17502  ORF Transcript_7165/g.17502 Transcript_7165/m.17502 type:complete len:245 (+) Transcript_7165:1038-1772(+)
MLHWSIANMSIHSVGSLSACRALKSRRHSCSASNLACASSCQECDTNASTSPSRAASCRPMAMEGLAEFDRKSVTSTSSALTQVNRSRASCSTSSVAPVSPRRSAMLAALVTTVPCATSHPCTAERTACEMSAKPSAVSWSAERRPSSASDKVELRSTMSSVPCAIRAWPLTRQNRASIVCVESLGRTLNASSSRSAVSNQSDAPPKARSRSTSAVKQTMSPRAHGQSSPQAIGRLSPRARSTT